VAWQLSLAPAPDCCWASRPNLPRRPTNPPVPQPPGLPTVLPCRGGHCDRPQQRPPRPAARQPPGPAPLDGAPHGGTQHAAGANCLRLHVSCRFPNAQQDALSAQISSLPFFFSFLLLQVDMPIFYGNKMRRKMKAGAGCEDLKVRCPHYYSVATRLHAAQQACLTADEAFPAFVLNTFRSRYKVSQGCGLSAVVCMCVPCTCGPGMCVWERVGVCSWRVEPAAAASAGQGRARCCLSTLPMISSSH
jgi:hypothetical protein